MSYAGADWVGCHPENFRVGRVDYNPPYQTFSVLAIGLHHTGTTFQGCIDTFLAAPSSGRNHSAHFAIRNSDGYKVQFVDTDDTAFALGYSQPNCYTVNIEHEQTWDYGANVKTSDFSDALYVSSAEIVRTVCIDKGIPIDADHIHGHNFWDTSNTCPADLDVTRIIALAQGGEAQMTPAEKRAFVRLAYVAGAGREPTQSELDWEAGAINTDADVETIVTQVLDSPEGQKHLADLRAAIASGGKPGPAGPPGPPGTVPPGTKFTGVVQ